MACWRKTGERARIDKDMVGGGVDGRGVTVSRMCYCHSHKKVLTSYLLTRLSPTLANLASFSYSQRICGLGALGNKAWDVGIDSA